MGVLVHRSIYLAEWTQTMPSLTENMMLRKQPSHFCLSWWGGHGRNSIGETVLYAQKGFDGGVIQLAPFACIPEIVAKSILPYVSRKLNIPVMTLFWTSRPGGRAVSVPAWKLL